MVDKQNQFNSQINKFQRLSWIDGIKGLAILGIITFHFFQIYPNSLFLVRFLDLHLPKIGFAMVDIFFLISGFNTSYALTSREQNTYFKKGFWLTWLKKRLIRIYPTYWLAIIFIYLLYFFTNRSVNFDSLWNLSFLIAAIPDYDLFKLINPGLWFVSVIIQGYLIIPSILSFGINKPQKILLLGIVIAIINKSICLAFGLNSNYTSAAYYFFLQVNFIGSYFFPLCLGLYWGIKFKQNNRFCLKDWQFSIGLFMMAIILQFVMNTYDIDLRYKLGLDVLVVPLLALILYAISDIKLSFKVAKYFQEFIIYLGRNSYPLFLIHQPIFFISIPFWNDKIPIDPHLEIILIAIATLINLSLLLQLFMKIDLYCLKLIKKSIL